MWSPNFVRLWCANALVAIALAAVALAEQQGAQPPPGSQPPAQKEQKQPPEQKPGTAPQAEQQTEQQQEPEAAPPLAEGIDVVEGSGYRYDSRRRRDPFVSLALGMAILPPEARPPGLAGMLIQEVSLHGIVKTRDGFIAMIQGTDNKSYFARVGERLYDGTIDSIDPKRVVFLQEINDPLRIEKFHRIEKSLHPVEEGK